MWGEVRSAVPSSFAFLPAPRPSAREGHGLSGRRPARPQLRPRSWLGGPAADAPPQPAVSRGPGGGGRRVRGRVWGNRRALVRLEPGTAFESCRLRCPPGSGRGCWLTARSSGALEGARRRRGGRCGWEPRAPQPRPYPGLENLCRAAGLRNAPGLPPAPG